MPHRPERSRRIRWRVVYALVSAALTVLALGVAGAATCRPSWYVPAAVDHTRLKADKRDFVRLLDAIGAALNAGEGIDFELDAAQLNRWIAGRAEIWPAWEIELEGISYPQVSLLDGNRVRLAARAARGPIEVVLSAVGRCELTADEILIRVETVRAGKLPLPCSKVLEPVRASLDDRSREAVRITDRTIRLRNEWTWQNGKRRFRVSRLEVSVGRAQLSFESLP